MNRLKEPRPLAWVIRMAGPLALSWSKVLHHDGTDLGCVTGLTEGYHAGDADLLHGRASWLQVIAWVKLLRAFHQHFANRSGDRHATVGINVDLAHAELDTALNLFNGHTVRLLHLSAVLIDNVLQFLRD